MWEERVLNKNKKETTEKSEEIVRENWYNKSENYWKVISPTVDGMLGGLSHVSDSDINDSSQFLKDLIVGGKKVNVGTKEALDVGAGIGRVTELLLSKYFQSVDLLEFNQDFLDVAKETVLKDVPQARNYYCSSMQDFDFTNKKYDVIWIQWVIIYLSDDDFIEFFTRCKNALHPNGLIILKDNIASRGFVLDLEDSSVTRTENHLRLLFECSGLRILRMKTQQNFPADLFVVKLFALKS